MVELRWIDDENTELWVNGEYIVLVNHDEHGSAGIGLIQKVAVRLAETLEIKYEDLEFNTG